MDATTSKRKTGKGSGRPQDPEGTRRNIIEIASEEFALNGLAGARIDEIAARTSSSKRMIYYYFGDKEGLYRATLENAYREIREGEGKLDIEGLSPIEAMRRLVEFSFDHHQQHDAFVRMVMIENIHYGRYLERSEVLRALNEPAITHVASIYARGVAEGFFRAGLDPIELHWLISALSFYSVSNRVTFSLIFGRDFGSGEALASVRQNAVETILRFVTRNEKLPPDSEPPAHA